MGLSVLKYRVEFGVVASDASDTKFTPASESFHRDVSTTSLNTAKVS